MCKHVAAALYGVGARLDASPELLFTLRNVSPSELIAEAAKVPSGATKSPVRGRALETEGLDDLFGIDLEKEEGEEPGVPRPKAGRPAREARPGTPKKKVLPQKSEEKPSLSGERRKRAKKASAGTKAAPPAEKKSPAARGARKKTPVRSSKEQAVAGAKKTEVAEFKTGTAMKKTASTSGSPPKKARPATGQSVLETETKARPGRPPGKSSPTRTNLPGKKTESFKDQGGPR